MGCVGDGPTSQITAQHELAKPFPFGIEPLGKPAWRDLRLAHDGYAKALEGVPIEERPTSDGNHLVSHGPQSAGPLIVLGGSLVLIMKEPVVLDIEPCLRQIGVEEEFMASREMGGP